MTFHDNQHVIVALYNTKILCHSENMWTTYVTFVIIWPICMEVLYYKIQNIVQLPVDTVICDAIWSWPICYQNF